MSTRIGAGDGVILAIAGLCFAIGLTALVALLGLVTWLAGLAWGAAT